MRRPILFLLVVILLNSACVQARDDIRKVPVSFSAGQGEVELKGQITGYETVDYQVPVAVGQELSITLRTSHLSTYFNLLPPGSNDRAVYIGSISGNQYTGRPTLAGTYLLRVYMMRSAARRKEVAAYTIDLSLVNPPGGEIPKLGALRIPTGALDARLELQGIGFRVNWTDQGSINRLRIEPSGLEIDNRPIEQEIEGQVTGLEVADLNADGSPELYIYLHSAGSGSYGSLIAYAANRRKSLSGIYLPPLDQIDGAISDYMGHDEFAVVENRLVRRFPIYRSGDINASPSGGTRQLQYRLEPGEAGWVLKLDRMVEY